jgi:hypothetical protein
VVTNDYDSQAGNPRPLPATLAISLPIICPSPGTLMSLAQDALAPLIEVLANRLLTTSVDSLHAGLLSHDHLRL